MRSGLLFTCHDFCVNFGNEMNQHRASDTERKLASLRDEIAAVDEQLLNCLRKRRELEHQVGVVKAGANLPVLNVVVEEKKLVQLTIMAIHRRLNFDSIRRIYKVVLMDSRNYQQQLIEELKGKSVQEIKPEDLTLNQKVVIWICRLTLALLSPPKP
jgi:chorismate mutase